MNLSKPQLITLMLIGSISLIFPIQSRADKNPKEERIPKSIYPGLHHFLDLVDPEKKVSFDPGLVADVMEFIEGPKDDYTLHYADGVLGIPSAYHEFDHAFFGAPVSMDGRKGTAASSPAGGSISG